MTDTPDGEVPSLTPSELDGLLRAEQPVVVLDVRDRDEFERWHVDGPAVEAVQAPHSKFITAQITGRVGSYAADLGVDPSDHVVVVCGRGEASRDVAGMLNEAGLDAASLDEGMSGWAGLFLGTPVGADDGGGTGRPDDVPTVIQYRRPSSGCLSYLVVRGRRAVAIDPLRAFAGRYAGDAAALGARLSYAVDTHVHADHVSGVVGLAERTDAEAVVPAGAVERGLDLPVDVRLLDPGDSLSVGEAALEAVALPGHTSGMTGLTLDRGDESLLFCGDSLFVDAVARPDLEAEAAGAPDLAGRLYDTLHDELLARPDATRLFPGHYASPAEVVDGVVTTTVGEARERDLLALDREAFVERVTGSMPARPANYERLIDVNLGRESVADEEAFALELGPNSCAAG